jgi:hypothetical protein
VKKPLFATLLGGFLGIFDGLTSLFAPDVRDQLGGIVIGSTIKGLVTGVLIGFFAKKVHSLVLGTVFGLIVGAGLAYIIVLMNPGHALNIMLPGSLVGLIVGYATQKHQGEAPSYFASVSRRASKNT